MNNLTTLRSVLHQYGIDDETLNIIPFGSGLINHTWKIELPGSELILQKINQDVFKEPHAIAQNIRMISDYLETNYPEYKFVAPITTPEAKDMVFKKGEGYYRLFPFVNGSHTIDVVQTPSQAYEAAMQFGRFTRTLAGFDATKLNITIPRFHDLTSRYQQFLQVIQAGNKTRVATSADLVKTLTARADIVAEYERIRSNPAFKIRVTHHDTKISNVLFDAEDRSIAVIDLDTVMPGYFISDLGDMMRTYLSPANEEEKDIDKIIIREEFFHAVAQGYFNEMKNELTAAEKHYFFYAGKFMIYMQAIRFLTDHLAGDIYYKAKYPDHNYYRARNQAILLERLIEMEAVLSGN